MLVRGSAAARHDLRTVHGIGEKSAHVVRTCIGCVPARKELLRYARYHPTVGAAASALWKCAFPWRSG